MFGHNQLLEDIGEQQSTVDQIVEDLDPIEQQKYVNKFKQNQNTKKKDNEKMKSSWLGNTTCDICHKPIKNTLYDAKTKMGCWGTICEHCFKIYGTGKLGTGFGQKYIFNEQTNKFEKQ